MVRAEFSLTALAYSPRRVLGLVEFRVLMTNHPGDLKGAVLVDSGGMVGRPGMIRARDGHDRRRGRLLGECLPKCDHRTIGDTGTWQTGWSEGRELYGQVFIPPAWVSPRAMTCLQRGPTMP